MKTVHRLAVSSLFLFFSLPLVHGQERDKKEEGKLATSLEARKAIETFREKFNEKHAFPALKESSQIEAVKELAKVRHPLVLDELIHSLKEKNPYVKVEVLRVMGFMDFDPRKAGKVLQKELKAAKEEKILLAILDGLKRIKYRGAYEELATLLDHEEDRVAIEAIRVFGEMKEIRAMKNFLPILEANQSANGISVRVDTNSPGSRDQRAAEARYRALAKMRRKRRGDLLQALQEAMKEISGLEISTAEGLREWIRINRNKIKKAEKTRW